MMSSFAPSRVYCQSCARHSQASGTKAPSVGASSLTLRELLDRCPTVERRPLLCFVAKAVQHLHTEHQTIYGDLKLENVIVSPDGCIQLRESARSVPISSEPRAPATPEERLPMTTATDVYAFAWLVFHAYTGIDPLELAADPKLMRLIASGVKPNRPGPNTLPGQRGLNSDGIWDILINCWEIFPNVRPEMAQVVSAFEGDNAIGSLESGMQTLSVDSVTVADNGPVVD